MDKTDSLNCESIKPTEVEDKQDIIMNSKVFRTGLGQTIAWAIHLEQGQGMDKIINIGQGMIQIIGVIKETIWEVIKGMGDKIIIEMDLGEISEIKAMGSGRSRSYDRQFRDNNRSTNRSISNSWSSSGYRVSTKETELDVLNLVVSW